MELIQIMRNRRSVRSYTQETVADHKLETILLAALLSPSGRARRPWEFIVVRDKNTLRLMSECRDGAAKMLEGADCAVVVIADAEKTDVWIEDCSIAMANMHLMADSLGIGSCWIQGRLRSDASGGSTEDYLRNILDFPKSHRLEAILSLGMPQSHPEPYSIDGLPMEKIHKEKY
jgi:nitroreductase